jgi:hypothetical protein
MVNTLFTAKTSDAWQDQRNRTWGFTQSGSLGILSSSLCMVPNYDHGGAQAQLAR